MGDKRKINSFADLDVYQRSLRAAITIRKEVLPQLKLTKEYDLADQLGRCTSAIPALIAEGHAKRNQPKHFQKYLDDAIGEANEAVVHLSLIVETCARIAAACRKLIEEYVIISKELFRLGQSWNRLRSTIPNY